MFIPLGVVVFVVFLVIIHVISGKAVSKKEPKHALRNKERCIQEAMRLPYPECSRRIAELKRGWGEKV